ncbi:MAG: TerC family protein, partial [Planctomyces sp.]
LQKRALTYGLVGAFVFGILGVATARYLLKLRKVKLFGGGYLVYIAVKHLFFESREDREEVVTVSAEGEPELRIAETGAALTVAQEAEELEQRLPVPVDEEVLSGRSFWWTVLVIELTDIAFAVDSILAAIALVGSHPGGPSATTPHPKLWVVIAGGVVGLMLMRVAAAMFIRLLEKFPRFEVSAYLLVIVIGLKLLVDWGFNTEANPHRIDFHNFRHVEFWVFWVSMAVALCVGFIPPTQQSAGPGKP